MSGLAMRDRGGRRWCRKTAVLALAGLMCSAAPFVQASDGDPTLGAFVRPEPVRERLGADRLPLRLPSDDALSMPPRTQVPACALAELARQGRDAELRAAVRRGADLDCMAADGFTPLAAAAFAGRRSTVRLLLQAGAKPGRQTASGQTPLHLAALAGQVEVIEEWRRHGGDIEIINAQRESALDLAAQAGQDAVMDLLLQLGADSSRAGRR
jgi:hypothetical protein